MRNQFGTGPGTGSSWHDRSDNQSPNVQKVLFCDGLNLFLDSLIYLLSPFGANKLFRIENLVVTCKKLGAGSYCSL